jgi:uncharacterized protein
MSRVEIVRRVYEAGAAQDLEELLDLADTACVITQDPSPAWGGRHVGHQGLTAFLSALFGTIDSEASTETLFEADGQVIQCGRTGVRCGRTGRPFELPEVHTSTVRNSKVVAAHFAIDTPAMLQALEGV